MLPSTVNLRSSCSLLTKQLVGIHQKRNPRLSRMVFDILLILLMSCEVEKNQVTCAEGMSDYYAPKNGTANNDAGVLKLVDELAVGFAGPLV